MALPPTHLLDEMATAYVQVIAAAAGATIATSRLDYGVDGTLKRVLQVHGRYVETGFPVDFQLKATTTVAIGQQHVKFDLKSRNYDLIVTRSKSATPFYLFLVCFPHDVTVRLVEQPERLVINASAFWWTEANAGTTNTTSVRIDVPVANRLTSRVVGDMLAESKRRFVND